MPLPVNVPLVEPLPPLPLNCGEVVYRFNAGAATVTCTPSSILIVYADRMPVVRLVSVVLPANSIRLPLPEPEPA